jgi:hypothetical protein
MTSTAQFFIAEKYGTTGVNLCNLIKNSTYNVSNLLDNKNKSIDKICNTVGYIMRTIQNRAVELKDREKKNKNVPRIIKNKKTVLKKTMTDKDRDICPLCGWKLVGCDAGMWCVNPLCEVLDDADDYK